ncbi:MAG: MerR family transcriptional regulator [Acidimicrobiia bacterium]|nr:MerR family transcriptional regulator [Acidimicrobiia bacterium]
MSDGERRRQMRDDGAVKQSFGGPEAAKLAGISYRQLDHWARKGLVLPSVASASGSGSQRRYSYQDLVELKIIKSLREAGLSLQRIERAFAYIREQLDEEPAGLRIFSDGQKVFASRSNDEILDLLNAGQVVFAFALDPIHAELSGSIEVIRPESDDGADVREIMP